MPKAELDGSTAALKGLRIGWLGDMGGHLALEPGIAAEPEALWKHDQAQCTNVMALMRASEIRSTFLHQLLALFDRIDVLALPTTQVCPFAIGERWPTLIGRPRGDAQLLRIAAAYECTIGELMARRPAEPSRAGIS